MSAPLLPSPLDYIGTRRFAFYPVIKNADPNEWRLRTEARSEIQVVNTKTGRELWIPRQYIGAVSDTGDPLLIVGLRKELNVRAGEVEPRIKRIIEMPRALEPDNRAFLSDYSPGPARVVTIRLEDRKKSAATKAVVGLAIGALLAWLLFGFDWNNCSRSSGLCAAISSR
jgi:hypothetical protein